MLRGLSTRAENKLFVGGAFQPREPHTSENVKKTRGREEVNAKTPRSAEGATAAQQLCLELNAAWMGLLAL